MRARRSFYRLRWFLLHPGRKLATLGVAEWRYLLHAQFALLWAQGLVWLRPLGRLVDSTPASAANAAATAGEAGVPAERAPAVGAAPVPEVPRQLALGVRRAAAYGVFRPLCLARSVALNRLLDRYGYPGSRIRVGVRWVDGKFAAHAWVEYQGQILGDDVEHVNRFADLGDVRVLKWS
jgi:hypothetical protein